MENDEDAVPTMTSDVQVNSAYLSLSLSQLWKEGRKCFI